MLQNRAVSEKQMQARGGEVRVEELRKLYRETVALDSISLTICSGEFFTLLGPSGSGKSTTLLIIAGFQTPTSGNVHINGIDTTFVPAHRRNLGMVFQNYALFP